MLSSGMCMNLRQEVCLPRKCKWQVVNSIPDVRAARDGEVECDTVEYTIKIDYFIESAPYGILFTSHKTLETNQWA